MQRMMRKQVKRKTRKSLKGKKTKLKLLPKRLTRKTLRARLMMMMKATMMKIRRTSMLEPQLYTWLVTWSRVSV